MDLLPHKISGNSSEFIIGLKGGEEELVPLLKRVSAVRGAVGGDFGVRKEQY